MNQLLERLCMSDCQVVHSQNGGEQIGEIGDTEDRDSAEIRHAGRR
jgi:hypothetical protein